MICWTNILIVMDYTTTENEPYADWKLDYREFYRDGPMTTPYYYNNFFPHHSQPVQTSYTAPPTSAPVADVPPAPANPVDDVKEEEMVIEVKPVIKKLKKSKSKKGEMRHKCNVCDKTFSKLGRLNQHLIIHSGELPFECYECGRRFNNKRSMKRHALVHTEDKPHKCTICWKSFTTNWYLEKHIFGHTGERPYECNECGKRFGDTRNLTRHILIHKDSKQFKCTTCDKAFVQKKNLQNHMRVHTGEKPFLCTECGKDFGEKSNFNRHILRHTGFRPHTCPICQRSFTQKCHLKSHLTIHGGERPYKCNDCNEGFADKSNLKKHMRIHTGMKAYQCPTCGKRFTQSAHLKSHLRIHSGEKPYQCTECADSFSDKSNLNKHMSVHTGVKPYTCTECMKSFVQRSHLVKHVRTHTGEKPFGCMACGKTFAKRPTLTAHIKREHLKHVKVEDQDESVQKLIKWTNESGVFRASKHRRRNASTTFYPPLQGVIMDFPPLKNDRILRAARGKEVDRVPVWVMRQAGRYLPEFRATRAVSDFFTVCRTPELACEVTLQPIRRYDLDAAIIFSDILVIPQALGLDVEMRAGVGPVLPQPLELPEDISRLTAPVDVNQQLGYVYEAITMTRHKLEGKVPLIGFVGAPWTLFGYMIEGGGSKTMSKAKKWLYQWPQDSKKLLNIITNVVVDHLVAQAQAGAQLLQVFESNAEYLGPEMFAEFALPYLRQISARVKSRVYVPVTIFAKGAHYAIPDLSNSGYDIIGVDWTIKPEVARAQSGENMTLQGNLDPCALYGPHDLLRKRAIKMVEAFGKNRYIANLGHGIYPDVDPEAVKVFIEAVHSVTDKPETS